MIPARLGAWLIVTLLGQAACSDGGPTHAAPTPRLPTGTVVVQVAVGAGGEATSPERHSNYAVLPFHVAAMDARITNLELRVAAGNGGSRAPKWKRAPLDAPVALDLLHSEPALDALRSSRVPAGKYDAVRLVGGGTVTLSAEQPVPGRPRSPVFRDVPVRLEIDDRTAGEFSSLQVLRDESVSLSATLDVCQSLRAFSVDSAAVVRLDPLVRFRGQVDGGSQGP